MLWPIHIKGVFYTHRGAAMRTNIEIDDKLMKKTIKASGARTKREAVVTAMRFFVDMREQQKALRELWGAAKWEGDLEQSRLSRFADQEW